MSTADFTERLANVESRMNEYYRFWQVHAPHFTDHGETHFKTVEKNLDELVPDMIKGELNEYEIFLLLASVYLHDIGIMCACTDRDENEEIRRNHHKRSEDFIINNMKDFLDGSERFVVGRISFAHRDEVSLDDIVVERVIRHKTLGNKQVRVRFLAALLRVADASDLCHTRTTENLVNIGKLPTEAGFHHALHERVSGISFDAKEKTVFIDLNIASNEEKAICQDYLVSKLQKSFTSAQDQLIKNGVVYIEVTPRYTITNALTTELNVPVTIRKQTEFMTQAKVPTSDAVKILHLAEGLYNRKKYGESLENCKKVLELTPKDPFTWLWRARCEAQLGDLENACKSYENATKFGSEDSFFNATAGHFFGEVMLDYKRSFSLFEKAYQQDPRNVTSTLNYAECLISVNRPQEAYTSQRESGRKTRIW